MQGAEGPRGPAGASGPTYTTRFGLRFDRGRGVESPRPDYSTGNGGAIPTLIDGAPGNRLNWSVQFFTGDGLDVRLDCRAAIRPDRTLLPGDDNPHCQWDSYPLTSRFADRFPLVITELSDGVLDLRASRIAFVGGWTFTDFALRIEVTNPTQPFVTPRADFRSTL